MARLIVIKIFVVMVCCLVLSFGLVIFFNRGTIFPAPQTRPTSDFYVAIDRNIPTLTKDGGRIYKIVSNKKLAPNWYDISIETADQSIAPGLRSQIIIFDPYRSANYMQIQAGPETIFSRTELLNDSIPNSVVDSVLKRQP